MKGIFFDESPNEFKEKRKVFMDAADARVKNADGLGGWRLVSFSDSFENFAYLLNIV